MQNKKRSTRSTRGCRRVVTPFLLLTFVLLAASATPAVAKVEHSFKGNFGSASKPAFVRDNALAVDQSTGDILVYDAAAHTVSRWHADGTPSNFTALGSNVIDGKGGDECPTVSADCDQTPQNGLFFYEAAEIQIAVDNSGTVTNGDIYVTQSSKHLIDVFSEDGEYLGQLTAAGATPFGEVCGVAVDASGAVYVSDYSNGVHKFVPSANPPLNADHTATFTSVAETCTLAAGAGPTTGSLFVTRFASELFKVDSSTGELKYQVGSVPPTHWTVSVDPATGHVYGVKTEGKEVIEYDASGGGSATIASTIEQETKVEGIAIDETSGDVYLSIEGSPNVAVYGPLAQPAPTVDAWVEEVVFSEATLRGRVNPKGVETTYRFEWGTDATYGNSTAETIVGSDETEHTVSISLEGLDPGTTYHWRLVASNEGGESATEDATFTTYQPTPPESDCANQAFRTGPGAFLPDCRAYEMVSPLDKNGGDITTPGTWAYKQATPEGAKITYSSGTAFADAVSSPYSSQYISSRGAAGWSTHAISAPRGPTVKFPPGPQLGWDIITNLFEAFTPDLCNAWERSGNATPLTPEGLTGFVNLYRRSNCGEEGYEALTEEEPGFPFGPSTPALNEGPDKPRLRFQGASEDLSHQVFVASAALTPDAASGENAQIYDLHDGQLELVSVLPGGGANPDDSVVGTSGSQTDNSSSSIWHAVSADGSRVFWMSKAGGGSNEGEIYVRVDGTQTLAVSEEGEALSGTSTSRFWTAAMDGSTALYSTGGLAAGADLYLFDVDTQTTTPLAGGVRGVAGAADDLSRIYFVSEEALATGAEAGEPNLYLAEAGAISLVAVLAGGDILKNTLNGASDIANPMPIKHSTRVTPDGSHLAFMSRSGRLSEASAGYDNRDTASGEAVFEVFLYDAEADELRCVSCNPSGARPQGVPRRIPYVSHDPSAEGGLLEAGMLPTWEHDQYASRALSEDGSRLFFHSDEALLPPDSNGVQDLYQWEAPGAGSCTEASPVFSESNGGCIALISTGKSPRKSEFFDADADGESVFFSTASGIDPRDPGLVDAYVARVGGGFPPPPPPPPPCVGDACQSVPEPPPLQTPASAAFRGAGDPAPSRARRRCAKGKRRVRRNGRARCVRRQSNRAANTGRRQGR